MWSLSPQHRCLHSGQGIQSEKPAHHSPTGQVDLRSIDVRSEPKESSGHGAADPQPTSAQGIRLSRGGRVSRVNRILNFLSNIYKKYNFLKGRDRVHTTCGSGQLQDWRLQSLAQWQRVPNGVRKAQL